MRITKEQKRENHDRIVAVASMLFRERGYDGVGVVDIMEHAGLTHGGFYNHFRSKEDLIAQATSKGMDETAELYADLDVLKGIDRYISRAHRDGRGTGCTAAALACEAPRQSPETRSTFAAGIEALVGGLAADMARDGVSRPGTRAQAISILAQAVGAIVLSRACPDDSLLADEILEACRDDCRDATRE